MFRNTIQGHRKDSKTPLEAGYPKRREHLPKYGKYCEIVDFQNPVANTRTLSNIIK